jgi:hypothetical protein
MRRKRKRPRWAEAMFLTVPLKIRAHVGLVNSGNNTFAFGNVVSYTSGTENLVIIGARRQWHRLLDRSGNVWDNAAIESFFSSLKTERTARKTYRTREDAKADVFDYIERFYNAKRRHSTAT